jgi:hypothetical protein
MYFPRSCPICRSESLQRVLRHVTFLAELGGEQNALRGVISYRCAQGHVFMILPTGEVELGRKSHCALLFPDARGQVR